MKTPILGSNYVARSKNAADNRMVNLYPEIVPEGGKEPAFLTRVPGLRKVWEFPKEILDLANGPIRGMHVWNGELYVMLGKILYKVSKESAKSSSFDRAVPVFPFLLESDPFPNDYPVTMAHNEDTLLIATGGNLYGYRPSDEEPFGNARESDPDFLGALSITYQGTYFVWIEPETWNLVATNVVTDLEWAYAGVFPDKTLRVISAWNELWVFGEESIEIWAQTDTNPDFPFEAIPGATLEIGCIAPQSIARIDNSLMWIGRNNEGHGVVYRTEGYRPVRVSTHSIEWQIQQHKDLSDAVAYSYQQDGHSFYVLSIPSMKITLAYDASTGVWHERGRFENGQFNRHRGNYMVVYDGEILVSDFENGNIYALDLNTFDEDGAPQKWLRSWRAIPTGENNLLRTSHHSLQLDCESGVGTSEGQGFNPEVMLRWSDDGGHTWSNERRATMGRVGQYGRRVIWHRLGTTLKLRDRVYEVSGTDPVKVNIMGAELRIGTNYA